jgi:hypothetical protein
LKWLISLVFPGVWDTFARFFRSVSILINEDFPTFDRPMNANSGRSVLGHCFRSGLEERNSALEIFMVVGGCWMLDTRCWMLDAGCWMLDVGF